MSKMRMERYKITDKAPCWDTGCTALPRWLIDCEPFCDVHAIREMRYILTAEPAIRSASRS